MFDPRQNQPTNTVNVQERIQKTKERIEKVKQDIAAYVSSAQQSQPQSAANHGAAQANLRGKRQAQAMVQIRAMQSANQASAASSAQIAVLQSELTALEEELKALEMDAQRQISTPVPASTPVNGSQGTTVPGTIPANIVQGQAAALAAILRNSSRQRGAQAAPAAIAGAQAPAAIAPNIAQGQTALANNSSSANASTSNSFVSGADPAFLGLAGLANLRPN